MGPGDRPAGAGPSRGRPTRAALSTTGVAFRRYLQAGLMVDGVVLGVEEGAPQGGPSSPLLANILLLDKELERRGHRFVRYADDCNIYVRTRKAGG